MMSWEEFKEQNRHHLMLTNAEIRVLHIKIKKLEEKERYYAGKIAEEKRQDVPVLREMRETDHFHRKKMSKMLASIT